MGSETYHEPYEILPAEVRELHRAILSLMEELEAVDWYTQRASACEDPELRDVLLHHRDEEIEHAMMNLEWLRRNHGGFDEMARRYLFTDKAITQVEEEAEAAEALEETGGASGGEARPPNAPKSLGIGSLRGQ